MKTHQTKSIEALLLTVAENLDLLAHPESRVAAIKVLDNLIATLTRLRNQLNTPGVQKQVSDIRQPINQVIDFLNLAKSDDTLSALILLKKPHGERKPKRAPVEIPANLTNQQIRALLEKNLSKSELKAIAAQRSISVGKSTTEQVKRDILKNLERQEGYGRLASS